MKKKGPEKIYVGDGCGDWWRDLSDDPFSRNGGLIPEAGRIMGRKLEFPKPVFCV